MTNEERQAIRERAEKATLGPWTIGDTDAELMNGKISHIGPVAGYDGDWLDMEPGDPDAEFIAHAREDIPTLLAEVERLRAAVEIARDNHAITAQQWEAAKAQNAAMREIVQAVATEDTCAYEGDAGDDVHCVFCQSEDDWREARARNELHHIIHTPDCPVTKARALLQEGI